MKRILVVATRQIGDVLLTTPLLHAARRRWPDARVEVIGHVGTLGMLRGNADVDGTIEVPARLGWRGVWALAHRLWRRYDLALIADPGDRAHLIGWCAARSRSGILPASGSSNWWKKRLLAHAVTSAGDRGEVHVVIEKTMLLAPDVARLEDQGRPAGEVPRVQAPAPAALPQDIGPLLQAGAVVMHVPSMWEYKQWPLAHYREVAAQLLAAGRQVVLTGSAGARDRQCIAALLDLGGPPQLLDVSGRLDFNQLAQLFAQSALYIGPDTSVSHLAAASGISVLAIFGPTNPQRWGPWPARPEASALFQRSALQQTTGNVTVLQAGGLACVPCGRAGCEDHLQSRSDCLVAITPQRVLDQALRLLGERPAA